MVNPTILTTTEVSAGRHNLNLEEARKRLELSRSSENLSTVCIIPHSGTIPAKAAQNWLTLTAGMNQRFLPMMVNGTDKIVIYNNIIAQVLTSPVATSCKYILTMEENIIPPFDGLLKLYENIDKYDVVGGLIWQTGIENVHPMVYGHPDAIPASFLPFPIENDSIQPCRGLSTGFTLFKIDIFRDPRVPSPWFRTKILPETGSKKSLIPDMFFFENIGKFGYKVACDTRVRLGNIDTKDGVVW
jgi:hypothetical protein